MRTRKTVTAFVLFACLFLGQSTRAQDILSGNTFLAGCKDNLTNSKQASFSVGICAGSVSTMLFVARGRRQDASICPPVNATVEQGIRVLVQYLESHPQNLHENFQGLLLRSFQAAWPCSK
jgi:hypothetical protein